MNTGIWRVTRHLKVGKARCFSFFVMGDRSYLNQHGDDAGEWLDVVLLAVLLDFHAGGRRLVLIAPLPRLSHLGLKFLELRHHSAHLGRVPLTPHHQGKEKQSQAQGHWKRKKISSSASTDKVQHFMLTEHDGAPPGYTEVDMHCFEQPLDPARRPVAAQTQTFQTGIPE